MKRSTFLIALIGIASGCAGKNNIAREPQQVGGDVGMRHINIESLSMENAGAGMKIAFRGPEAESFYNTLPESLVRENPELSVGVVARGQLNSVLIRCARKRFDGNDQSYHLIPNGPLCTISVERTSAHSDLMQNKWVFPSQQQISK